ncbi:MAG: endopeptidase La [Odoribacteraceae bacterium]|jgi:ATP-dependent Lon protease|nr:endopeptidase La [Odoribacteraceae bacterium]
MITDDLLKDIVIEGMLDESQEFLPLQGESDKPTEQHSIPDTLPILPLRNTVLFPGVIIPINIGREKSLRLVQEAYKQESLIGVITQRDMRVENPEQDDLYSVGTLASVLRLIEMPDSTTTAILQGRRRFLLDDLLLDEPYHVGKVTLKQEERAPGNDEEYDAIADSLKEVTMKVIRFTKDIPEHIGMIGIKNIESIFFLINFVSSSSNIDYRSKQDLLEIDHLKQRAIKLLELLNKQVNILTLKQDIQQKVKADIDKQQREYFLQQQMKTIQNELGGNPVDEDTRELEESAKKKKWSKQVGDAFQKELAKLKRQNPTAPDYAVQLNYLKELIDLPWKHYSKDNLDLTRAAKVLDEDHYGLEKVKERILEYLAVLKLKGNMKSPILCLYGPPGVGKTSLGKSVARALNREFVRVSLGGLHDEAEIRGHRRTYIGAMPGRIIQNIKKAGVSNPVFVLDEIDKVGRDFHGNPQSALLEVLDPEQNTAFHDNYLDLDYDLSKVMFIATANDLSTIAPPLRDRMEMIEVSGYLLEEKREITRRHLLPKQLENHGLKNEQLTIDNETLAYIIDNYTRESGVRALDKTIAKIARRVAKQVALDPDYAIALSKETARDFLGTPPFTREKYQGNEQPGVVTGLAWTAVGGEILHVESSTSKGKGLLTMTGSLGDVMKESATLALEYLKAHAAELRLDPAAIEQHNFHVHVPAGAVPKDGPSAGITMVTSLASSLLGRRAKKSLAMTGEITLRGKVLPVGGIREKILAAKRAGIQEIILCEENKKEIEEIKKEYIEGIHFHFVTTIREALAIALPDD